MKAKRNVLVTPGWYDPSLMEGIGRYAREAGWHLELRAMLEGVVPSGWAGDGMLANDTAVSRLQKFVEEQAPQQPTVLIGSNHTLTSLPQVAEDNRGMGRIAAEHFMDRGYRNYAWFSVPRGVVEQERRESFVIALGAKGHSCHLLEWGRRRGRKKDTWGNVREWLSEELKGLPKPLALFVLDDLLAVDAVQSCLDSGLRVPEDVAVLGVGNLELVCECSPVVLSSVDESLSEIAYRAARLLDRLMDGEAAPAEIEVVPSKGLVLRKSTEHFAITEPALGRAAAFMTEHYAKSISLEDVAKSAGISLRSLHYAFERELRQTPARHLLRIRLDRAKEMVEQGNEKVGAIAVACGFLTLRNFHRAFIKEFGIPPGAYRKRLRGGE